MTTANDLMSNPQSGAPLSNDDVVEVLNDLLENTRDGEYGFKTCAEQVETASAKQLFASRAEGCRQAGTSGTHWR